MKNETLLQKVRESKVQGPFKIDIKDSFVLYSYGLGFLTPLLKRWRQREKSLQSTQDVADYFEKHYLGKDMSESGLARGGYWHKIISERKGLGNSKILKLRDIPHFDSEAVKRNYPDFYIWLRVRPSF